MGINLGKTTKGLLLLFFLTIQLQAQDPHRIRLIFAGDIMCHETQLISAFDSVTDNYNFNSYFKEISPLIQTADLAIANLETTLPGDTYSGYPAFGSPDQLVQMCKDAGFNCLVTANNHSYDKGMAGLQRTIQILNQKQILHTGTFVSQEEKDMLNPLILKVKEKRIALLNYSYGINAEFDIPDYCINTIDTSSLSRDIKQAKYLNPDFLICFLHWGDEYNSKQSQSQQKLANWLHKQGIDVIIGSHPHVIQPIEIIKNQNKEITGITAFSLGNLISNQRFENRKRGSILEITLNTSKNNIQIESVIIHNTMVLREPQGNHYEYRVTLPFLPSPTLPIADL